MISTPQSQFLSSSPHTSLSSTQLIGFSPHIPFTQPALTTTLFVPPPSSTTPCCMESPTSLQFNSPSPELPPTQPTALDTDDDVVPPCSSLRVEGELPSIQPETSGVNSCMHEVESDSNLEIIDQLRKAQAKVRFLKKKLRQRGISNKINLIKHSSRNQHLFSISPEAADLERAETSLGGNMREKNLRKNHTMRRRILRRKYLPDKSVTNLCRLHERENSESGEYVQRSPSKKGWEREEEDSMEKIFKMKNSETLQEQTHSMDSINHLNSQYNVIAPNSSMWDCNLRILQGPEGTCSNECSSTLLQELEGDLFAQKSYTDDTLSSKRHVPLADALGPVYSQSTAMTLVKSRDEGGRLSYLQSGAGYFKCSPGQEFSVSLNTRFSEQALMVSNLAAESALGDSDLLLHQNTAVDLLETQLCQSSHESLGCEHLYLLTSGHHSAETQLCQSSFIQHQYPSSYFDSKQIKDQQNSAEYCGSDFQLHQSSSNSMMHSRCVAGFNYECPRAQQYSLQASEEGLFYRGITECKPGDEIWKQEPSEEQRLMDDLLAEKLWAEDETFSLDRYDFSC